MKDHPPSIAKPPRLGFFDDDAELSDHDPDVQEWDSLCDDETTLYTRMMEVYAGFAGGPGPLWGR